MEMEVRAEFILFGTLKREGRWWIAHCPPLDVSTQGQTASEARKNLVEACELFIASCLERGTFDRAMKELGLTTLRPSHPRIPPNAFKMAIPPSHLVPSF